MEETRTPVRRIAGPNAKNRTVLCDAVERIVLSEGSSGVSSRRVAAEAGLKPQLVHYYFATMDDLLVATFQRMAEEGLTHQRAAAAGPRPLRAMWAMINDQRGQSLLVEFFTMATHRPALAAEIRLQAARFRTLLTGVIADALDGSRPLGPWSDPDAVAVLLTSTAEITIMERSIGFTAGHDAVRRAVDDLLELLEPLD